MQLTPPQSNVLIPILCLGANVDGNVSPAGSSVIVNLDEGQYLATALHVAEGCAFQPFIRLNGRWNSIRWRTVAIDRENDIAVLATDVVLDDRSRPVHYGEVKGLMFGQVGYALGYPNFPTEDGLSIDHIVEVEGRPIPLASLVVANFAFGKSVTYSAAYVNNGFSGGAIAFPLGQDDWTIAGIITHFPAFPRPVYRGGQETGDFVMQHTGLVGYASFEAIRNLISAVGG